jgi:hypothetical protein
VSQPKRLRAPHEDRGVVSAPPLAHAGKLLDSNRRLLARDETVILGRSLPDLRRQARQDALALARHYLEQAGEPVPALSADSLVLAGHQPEIFHPGVWVKNFALHGLARQHECSPVNLIVDSDVAKSTVLHLPAWKDGVPYRAAVPFDRRSAEVPFEERAVQDEDLFAGFPIQAAEYMTGWNFAPMLPSFWAEAMAQAPRTPLLGERIVAARRAYERRWGCHNLELPVSSLCQTEPFAWFACHFLQDLPRFHALYNEVLRDYRRAHGIRSSLHPVPDLARDGDWLETPFWAWRAGEKRRHLFARVRAAAIDLRAGNDPWPTLTGDKNNPQRLLQAWRELSPAGYKIRTRALTTTLFARLFLADLFVHGIGGGIYDELTDALVRKFYGLEPPAFLVLSATLLLPFRRSPAREQDCRRLAQRLRDFFYNPQRHLPAATVDAGRRLAEEKNAWIARAGASYEELRERHLKLRDLTVRLRPYLTKLERKVRVQLDSCRRQVRANQVLGRRDFAFCLYPEALLREFCTGFLFPAE